MIWLKLFERAERFLIVVVRPVGARAAVWRLSEERVLTVERSWDRYELSQSLRRSLFSYRKFSVIVTIDPRLTSTVTVPVRLGRAVGAGPTLTAAELENSVSRAINQDFIRYRDTAGRLLGVSNLDVMVADSRLSDFKVDGYRVHNPLGFSPRRLEAVAHLTFVSRNLYQSLHSLMAAKNFFLTDAALASLGALRKLFIPPLGLAFLDGAPSLLYTFEPAARGFSLERKTLAWSADCFVESLTSAWAVSSKVAQEIYDRYLKGEFSPQVRRELKAIFEPGLNLLERRLASLKTRGPVILVSERPLPRAPRQSRDVLYLELPVLPLAEKAGLQLTKAEQLSRHDQFLYLTALLEYFSDRGEVEINRWLRRRLHWLGSITYN